ncbi:hypothetical protein XENOCAPTIV_002677 [Xenoophorus captivus]|uniref:Secreted protein n=1 Tax=Xenoophorus captivus TaxID=1517983 RepID=A0ABV0Q8B0_9TELE
MHQLIIFANVFLPLHCGHTKSCTMRGHLCFHHTVTFSMLGNVIVSDVSICCCETVKLAKYCISIETGRQHHLQKKNVSVGEDMLLQFTCFFSSFRARCS